MKESLSDAFLEDLHLTLTRPSTEDIQNFSLMAHAGNGLQWMPQSQWERWSES